ncbi:MAG: ParA family protein [Desulfobacter sp.]|nr:MAG: ParA family protein [Desulfobacter sp.]
MSHILTISGPRGGSGKSVTALNLSASMGLYNKKVLLVDCDPLGAVSRWSGVETVQCPFDLASVLRGKTPLDRAVVKTQFPSLDVLPAGTDLFALSLNLSRAAANEKILRLLMEDIRRDYNFIILDAPSSCGFLSIAAMTAADRLVAAMSGEDGWIGDFYALLKSVQYIRKSHDRDLKIAGISLNRCSDSQDWADGDVDGGGSGMRDLLYDNRIPDDRTVQEAVGKKTPLVLYDVNAPAARAYLGLAREIILSFN